MARATKGGRRRGDESDEDESDEDESDEDESGEEGARGGERGELRKFDSVNL